MNKYINNFFSLRCAGDVLNTVGAVSNIVKEITEAMAVRRILKDITLKEKMKYHVMDFCAGNGLLGVLTVFTLPVLSVTAIDRRKRKINCARVDRYSYEIKDIFVDEIEIPDPAIICGVHTCRSLAERIIDIYMSNENAKKLVMMPCCVRSDFPAPTKQPWILDRIPRTEQWVWYLAEKADGMFKEDKNVLSPRNKIIMAEKS